MGNNIKGFAHYLLLYLAIISQGAVLYNNHEDVFLVISLAIGAAYLVYERVLLKPDRCLFIIYIIIFGLLCTVAITGGSLSIASVGNVASKLLLAYCAVNIDRNRVAERYVKIVTLFAVFSLVIFSMQIVNYDLITKVFNKTTQENGDCYGWLFGTVAATHATRNVGLANEPGRYQLILFPALYFLYYKNEQIHMSTKQNMLSRIVIIAALITTQSTTGYISLIILCISFAVSNIYRSVHDANEKKLNRKTMLLLVMMGVALIVYLTRSGDDNFIYENFINKLFNSSGQIDLSTGTGIVRIISALTDLKLAIKHPFGMGFEDYQALWLSSKVKFIPESSSCAGLTISCAAFGFPVTFAILYLYFSNAKAHARNLVEFAALLALLFNTVLAQPQLYYVPVLIMFFAPKSDDADMVESDWAETGNV